MSSSQSIAPPPPSSGAGTRPGRCAPLVSQPAPAEGVGAAQGGNGPLAWLRQPTPPAPLAGARYAHPGSGQAAGRAGPCRLMTSPAGHRAPPSFRSRLLQRQVARRPANAQSSQGSSRARCACLAFARSRRHRGQAPHPLTTAGPGLARCACSPGCRKSPKHHPRKPRKLKPITGNSNSKEPICLKSKKHGTGGAKSEAPLPPQASRARRATAQSQEQESRSGKPKAKRKGAPRSGGKAGGQLPCSSPGGEGDVARCAGSALVSRRRLAWASGRQGRSRVVPG